MTTCALAWLVALIALPFIVLAWATESRQTRIQRLRANGYKWKTIANRYGKSESTVRRWSIA